MVDGLGNFIAFLGPLMCTRSGLESDVSQLQVNSNPHVGFGFQKKRRFRVYGLGDLIAFSWPLICTRVSQNPSSFRRSLPPPLV